MSRRRSLLLVQILSFLLVTLLGVATGNLTHDTGALPWGVELLRRGSLPLAGAIVLVIIGLMVWQHLTEERLALPARSMWDSDRPPFPGLEAFTEQDLAVFFGRDAEIAELAGSIRRGKVVADPSRARTTATAQALRLDRPAVGRAGGPSTAKPRPESRDSQPRRPHTPRVSHERAACQAWPCECPGTAHY
jgi:hypothetical protein